MQLKNLPNALRLSSLQILTCTDPALIPLIHAHDEALMQFVAQGRTAASKESPVPPPTA